MTVATEFAPHVRKFNRGTDRLQAVRGKKKRIIAGS